MKLQPQAELLNYFPHYKRYKHFCKRLITILLIRNNKKKTEKAKKNNVSDSLNFIKTFSCLPSLSFMLSRLEAYKTEKGKFIKITPKPSAYGS